MPRFRTRMLTLFAGGLLLLGAGCGNADGQDVNIEPDTGVPGGNDTAPTNPGDVECVGNGDCELTQRCNDNNECVPINCNQEGQSCRGELRCNQNNGACVECTQNSHCLGPSKVCNNNSCQQTQVECLDDQGEARVGQSCDPESEPGEGFACVNLGQQTNEEDTGHRCVRIFQSNKSCGGGEVCLPVDYTQYDKLSETRQGLCLVSQCDGPFDHQDCQDVQSNAFFPNLGGSGPFGGGAKKCAHVESAETSGDICVPSGDKGVGEYCSATFCPPGAQNCSSCQQGLTCVENSCQPLCRSDSECGDSNRTCIGEENAEIATPTTGFCGEQCESYSRGTCSSGGKGCAPINDDVGFCRNTGSTGYFGQCSQDTDCKEGMDCRLGVCTPICQAAPAGSNDTLSNDLTCRGKFQAQFANIGNAPDAVDIYVNGELVVNNLGTGEVSDNNPETSVPEYLELRPGLEETTVSVTPGASNQLEGNRLAEYTETLKSGAIRTWAIRPNHSSPFRQVPTTRRVEAPQSSDSKVRVAHYVEGLPAQRVEVVGLPRDSEGNLPRGSQGNLDWSSAVTLTSNPLANREVSSFTTAPRSSYDVFVFPPNSSRSTDNALARFERKSMGPIQTLYLYGSAARNEVGFTQATYEAPENIPSYSCWNRAQATNPEDATGYCVDSCEVSEYGDNPCSNDTFDKCTNVNGQNLCLSRAGEGEPGDSCSTGQFGQPCEEGAECVAGTCYSQCVGGGQTSNPNLSCRDQTSSGRPIECMADEGEFGTCGPTCEPDENFTDSDCPSGLKNCIPERVTEDGEAVGAFCETSGDKAQGESCGGGHTFRAGLDQNCQAGLRCAQSSGFKDGFQDTIIGMWRHQYQEPDNVCLPYRQAQENPTCRPTCRLFQDDSGCPEGTACFPDLAITESAAAGVCIDKTDNMVPEKESTSPCEREDVGKLCGENSICVQAQGSSTCYELCDWNTKEGCSGTTTCDQQFTENIGLCAP